MTALDPGDMNTRVKIPLLIDDVVMRELEVRAARDGRTMSELAEAALRRLLDERVDERELPPLPVMRARQLVEVSDRDALYRVMEEP